MNARAASLVRDQLPADELVHRSGDEATNGPTEAVRAFEELPDFVRHAKFRQVNERVLNAKLFETIVSQRPMRDNETDWAGRLKRRQEALQPYIGKMLACVYVRLPGVHYTIEVDVESCAVVYWEWQAD
jgi:hypothetical protein